MTLRGSPANPCPDEGQRRGARTHARMRANAKERTRRLATAPDKCTDNEQAIQRTVMETKPMPDGHGGAAPRTPAWTKANAMERRRCQATEPTPHDPTTHEHTPCSPDVERTTQATLDGRCGLAPPTPAPKGNQTLGSSRHLLRAYFRGVLSRRVRPGIHEIEPVSLDHGLPQGCPRSSLLFTVFLEVVLEPLVEQ